MEAARVIGDIQININRITLFSTVQSVMEMETKAKPCEQVRIHMQVLKVGSEITVIVQNNNYKAF